jgi:hypothetical protein
MHDVSAAFLNEAPVNDPPFLIVSLIGYLNTVAPLGYRSAILRERNRFFPQA